MSNKYFGQSSGTSLDLQTLQALSTINVAKIPLINSMNQNVSTVSDVTFDDIKIGNGLVTAPSLSFTSDNKTGIYSTVANDVRIASDGVEIVDVSKLGVNIYKNVECFGNLECTDGKNVFFSANQSGNAVISGDLSIGKATNDYDKVEIVGSLACNSVNILDNVLPCAYGFNSSKTCANSNSIFGSGAGTNISTGINNSICGFDSSTNCEDGSNNSSFGYKALISNISGSDSVAVGNQSLRDTTGSYNSCVGSLAGQTLTTGVSNCGLGYNSLKTLTTGSKNIGIGVDSSIVAAGVSNVIVGDNASALGNYGVSIGTDSKTNTNSVNIGFEAGKSLTTGDDNVLIGAKTAAFMSTGYGNVCIGDTCAPSIITGAHNVIIGREAMNPSTDSTNAIAIGYQAVAASNAIEIGNSSHTASRIYGKLGLGQASGSEMLEVTGNIKSTGVLATTVTTTNAFVDTYTNDSIRALTVRQLGANVGAPIINLHKNRGDVSAPLTIVNGDYIGAICSYGYTNELKSGSNIYMKCDNLAANVISSNIQLQIASSGTPTDRMLMNSTGTRVYGNLGLGQAPGTEMLEVTGSIKSTVSNVIADGSVSVPSLRFGTETTGLYKIAASTIGMTCNGAKYFQVGAGTGASIFVGTGAGQFTSTDDHKGTVCIGMSAGNKITGIPASVPESRVMIGPTAGAYGTSQKGSVIIGPSAGVGVSGQTGGDLNTFVGMQSGYAITTGSSNCFVGKYSGKAITSGNNNVFYGGDSGVAVTSGTNNVCIGHGSDALSATDVNVLAIGYLTKAATNTVVIGNSDHTSTRLYGNVGINQVPGTNQLEVTGNIKSTGVLIAPKTDLCRSGTFTTAAVGIGGTVLIALSDFGLNTAHLGSYLLHVYRTNDRIRFAVGLIVMNNATTLVTLVPLADQETTITAVAGGVLITNTGPAAASLGYFCQLSAFGV